MLNSDEIRATTFTRVRWRAGYDIDEVDSFLVDLAFALDTRAGVVSRDVATVRFQPTKFRLGYLQSEVDAFMKRTRRALL